MLPRLKIRHLMILIVYTAVSLAAMTAAVNQPEPRLLHVVYASILLPFVLSGLSLLILRPGPGRDWVVAFFWTIFHGLFAILMTASALLVLWLRGPVTPIIGMVWLGSISFFGCLLLLGNAIRLGRLYLIPTQCRRCGRKSLIRAALSHMASNWSLYYVRCGICDRKDHLDVSRIREGCPNCHRPTFILIRYRFYWCLNCHGRFKPFARRLGRHLDT